MLRTGSGPITNLPNVMLVAKFGGATFSHCVQSGNRIRNYAEYATVLIIPNERKVGCNEEGRNIRIRTVTVIRACFEHANVKQV